MQLALNELRRAEFWIPWTLRGVAHDFKSSR
jgi:hypothetical protein